MVMKITRKWLALILAMSLLAGTLAPKGAVAYGGLPSKPTESDDPAAPPVDQFGDPDGSGSGRSIQWISLDVIRQILIASMRIGVAPAGTSMKLTTCVAGSKAATSTKARVRGTR
jgi:hypothetical protein